MTSLSPSPHGPAGSSTRVRVKWDNVMIVLIGIVVAAFAVVGILLYANSGTTPAAAKDPSTEAAGATTLPESAVADEAAPGALSLEDSVALVEEVRALMSEGRWVEATDRLELIPSDLRDASGATAVQTELEERRATHEQLRAELEAAVEARNWTDAQAVITKLAALAPLDADLMATKELIDTALTPKATTPAATPKAAAADASTTGGGSGSAATKPTTSAATKPATGAKPASSTTKPAGSGTRPSTGGARPTVTGGGAAAGGSATGTSSAGAGAGSSTGTSGAAPAGAASGTTNVIAGAGSGASLGSLGIELTPAQEAELEAALAAAMAGL